MNEPDPTLLERTLEAARPDPQFVTSDGVPVQRLTHGVQFRESPTHVDDRG